MKGFGRLGGRIIQQIPHIFSFVYFSKIYKFNQQATTKYSTANEHDAEYNEMKDLVHE